MTIKGEGGTSGTKAITSAVDKLGKRVTRDAMTVWNTESQKRLMDAAGNRSGLDDTRDQRGSLQGRRKNQLQELGQSFTAPAWNKDEQAWQFAVTHEAAAFHEWGAVPHEIEAKQARVLAFEWPDAPEEVRERFQNTFPTVFFDKVQHPGVPAIGYLRYGREQARERLKQAGFDARTFESEVDQ